MRGLLDGGRPAPYLGHAYHPAAGPEFHVAGVGFSYIFVSRLSRSQAMMHRYFVTTRLHEVFDDAYAVAEPDEITASHLLLALLREGKSLGACYLHIRGIPTRELAAELEQELGVRVGRHRTGVPDRPWTPDGEAWLRAAHEEATGLWPDHAEIRKVASTETLLLALLAKAPRHLAPYGVGHADCVAVIRWAHEPADSRPPLPPFLA